MGEVACQPGLISPPGTEDRRRGPRQLTLMRVGLIHACEGQEFCLVRNISTGGMMASVYRSFPTGAEVRVELTTGHILVGDVVWARGCDIGVQFRGSIDVDTVLATRCGPESARRPRLPRLNLFCPGVARYGGGSFVVDIENISQRGAKMVGRLPVPKLAGVVLALPDLAPIQTTVRWSRGNQAGLFFNENLPFSVLARWVDARRQLERGAPGAPPSSPGAAGTAER